MLNALREITRGNIYTTDPHNINIHELRNIYGADFVVLLTDDLQYCGIAWIMRTLTTDFYTHAYSVVLP